MSDYSTPLSMIQFLDTREVEESLDLHAEEMHSENNKDGANSLATLPSFVRDFEVDMEVLNGLTTYHEPHENRQASKLQDIRFVPIKVTLSLARFLKVSSLQSITTYKVRVMLSLRTNFQRKHSLRLSTL